MNKSDKNDDELGRKIAKLPNRPGLYWVELRNGNALGIARVYGVAPYLTLTVVDLSHCYWSFDNTQDALQEITGWGPAVEFPTISRWGLDNQPGLPYAEGVT